MTQELSDREVKKYSFFKGKNATIESLSYNILDIKSVNNNNSWKPVLVLVEINLAGTAKYNHTTEIPLIDALRLPSISIIEAETLKYNEYGCVRIIEIIDSLSRYIPGYSTNQEVLSALRTLHQYQSMYNDPSGEAYFAEIMDFFATSMQRFK